MGAYADECAIRGSDKDLQRGFGRRATCVGTLDG